jgi:hypothetical protein
VSRDAFEQAYTTRRFDVDKAVRAAKTRLSADEQTKFVFGARGRGVVLSRGTLDEEIERQIRRGAATLEVGLAELSGVRPLAALILSGGSSRIPLVRQMADDLAKRFGATGATTTPRDIGPGHAVALGAVDAAVSGAYGPLTQGPERAERSGAAWSPGRVSREAVWADADSDASAWFAALAQYPLGTVRRRVIFLNDRGDFVAAAGEGSRIAVLRGWDEPDLRQLCSGLVLDTLWDRYQAVNGIPSLRPDRSEASLMRAPVRRRRAVVVRGSDDDPQCGWLDGRPVALVHRPGWAVLVEIGDSYGPYRRQFPRPSPHRVPARYPFAFIAERSAGRFPSRAGRLLRGLGGACGGLSWCGA